MSPVNEVKRIIGQFIIESRYLYCFVVDKNGCVFYSNAAFNRFFKTNKSKINGEPLIQLFAESHQPQVHELIAEVFEAGSHLKTNWIINTAFGSVFHINVEINLLEVDDNTYAVGIIQDQTKEKHLEKSLNQQNENLQSLIHQSKLFIKTAQIGTWVLDLENNEFTFNDILLEFFEQKREDILGTKIWRERIHPEDLPIVEKYIAQLNAGEAFNKLVFRIVSPSGNIKYLQSSAISIKNSAGEVVKLMGADLDITSQKMEEQAKLESAQQLEQYNRMLQLKNEQLELAVSTAELGLWSYNFTSNKLIWNNRQFELFEINQEDFDQDPSIFRKLLHPDDMLEGDKNLQKALNKEYIPGHIFRINTSTNQTKYLFGSMAPIINDLGEVEEVHGVNIDLTELMLAQEVSESRKKQLTAITDTIPGVVVQFVRYPDGSSDYRFMSKGVKQLFGLDYKSARKNMHLIWNLILEEDAPRVAESVEVSMKNLSLWNETYRIKTPNGQVKHLLANGLPHKGKHGEVIWDTIIQDITQQVEQDRALTKQREMLSKLSNQVPGVVYIYQLFPDGTDSVFYISNGVEEVFEVNAEAVMADSQLIWKQIVNDDLSLVLTSIEESKNTQTNWEATYRIKTPSGKIKHIRASGTPHLLENGTMQWYCMGSDITSFLEQQDEIEAQKDLVQQITNQIPGVVIRIRVDTEGTPNVDYVSNGVTEMFGLSKKEVLADFTKLWFRHHPDDLEDIQQSMDKALEKQTQWVHIHRYFNANDEVKYMQGFGTPRKLPDGTIEWSIITLDITDRIEAEQKASLTSAKLRSFINASPIAIYQIDPLGTVTDFWNPSAELIFGWERDYVLGKIVPFISDENKDSFFEVINDIEATHRPKQFPFSITNRFGEKLQMDITAGPIFNEQGKLTDLLIIANDVTELEDYRRTIEKALREKEILLQEIHHRVKNNLAIVSGLLELQALRDDSEADLSLIIEARNRIHSIAMVHEQLYRDMDFSHINPRDYYNKLLKKLQANTVSGTRNIEYDLIFDVERININQAVPLGLLINELFTNSVKYAFKNGDGKLRLHFLKENDRITVHYADNGPGFKIDEVKDKNTIGWQLIITLLAQLDSEYTIDTDGKFDLTFTFDEVAKGSQTNY